MQISEFKISLVYRAMSRIGRQAWKVKETIKIRTLVEMSLKEGSMFLPQQAVEQGSFSHMVLAVESRTEERYWGISIFN